MTIFFTIILALVAAATALKLQADTAQEGQNVDIANPPPPIHFTTFSVRARTEGSESGAKLVIKVGRDISSAKTLHEVVLSKDFKVYTFKSATRGFDSHGDLFVDYVNDSYTRNAIVDWIKINEETRQAQQYLNTGAYTSGAGCGTGLSSEISCPGHINFGGVYLKPKSLTLRAKGYSNSEIVEVKVGGKVIGRIKLSNNFGNYTMRTTENQGDVTVEFTNDANQYTTVEVDYIRIVDDKNQSDVRRAKRHGTNTGAYLENEGKCGTRKKDPVIACAGHINFGQI